MTVQISGTTGIDTVQTSALSGKSIASPTITGTLTANNISFSGLVSGNGLTIAAGAPAGALQIDSAGNAGLGVVPSAWSGFKSYQVNRGSISSVGPDTYFSHNWCWNGIADVYIGNDYAARYSQQSGHHRWQIAPSGTAGNPITFTHAMTLDVSGNLLVGGTSNSFSARIYSLETSATEKNNVALYTTGAHNTTRIGLYNDISAASVQSIGGALSFSSGGVGSGAERMRIDASGYLMVGTTTQLGSAKFTMQFDGASLNGACFRDTKTIAGADDMLIFQRGSTQVGSISTTLTATAYNTGSDYRLKENVAPLTNALDTIAALKPCTFTWKADGSADRGFIAHELQEVIPQAVSGEKDAVDDEGNIQPQGVDYGKITPEIVAALQEAYAIITDLKARIEQLENR